MYLATPHRAAAANMVRARADTPRRGRSGSGAVDGARVKTVSVDWPYAKLFAALDPRSLVEGPAPPGSPASALFLSELVYSQRIREDGMHADPDPYPQ